MASRIGHMAEFRGEDMLQTLNQPLIHKLVEERHLLRRIVQHITDYILQHAFGKASYHPSGSAKAHFRLNHPELSRMAGGVGIFRAEGRPEGVYVSERKSIGFRIQLPAYRKVGRLAEKSWL